jgi:FMN-dependent NADH-azoreductase
MQVERLRSLTQALPHIDLEFLTAAARKEAEEEAKYKLAEYEEELAASKKLLAELGKTWECKLQQAADIEKQVA